MKVARNKVFKSNRSQAVRLPKAVEWPTAVKEVDIVAIGNTRIITPSGGSWESWFEQAGVSEDFISSRDQANDQEREAF